jgi:uncharacterized repeat protein (TIGR01451 family)
MPSPINLDIQLTSGGDEPVTGAVIHYTITVKNNTTSPVTNVSIWDTIPADTTLQSIDFRPALASDATSAYLHWDLSLNENGKPFILEPDAVISITYTVIIGTIDPNKLPLTNKAGVDYNDPVYVPSFQKHPPLYSEESLYPTGKPVAYPNPYSIGSGKTVKFGNIVPGSIIRVFTLSGESVKDIQSSTVKDTAQWDGRNKAGSMISPGIYYFTINNPATGVIKKGKLFAVK